VSWRVIFFINVPVGLLALFLVHRYMPDYRGGEPRPLDVPGLILFSSGTAILSWLLEIFGEHSVSIPIESLLLVLSLGLLVGYALHARGKQFPLLRLALFRVRTFRVSVLGGFVTRLGIGGLPFLLPLLYQVGMGFPAWKSGLLMMPAALAAMGMKLVSQRLLKRFGYRQILTVNTLCVGATIGLFSTVGPSTPLAFIVLLGLMQGFFNSMQFSSMNSLAYADVAEADSSMASTISSSFQQLSMSFGLAVGSLVAGWYLGKVPQTNQVMVTQALHHAFITLSLITMVSSLTFWRLRREDGESISRGIERDQVAPAVSQA
jgi:Na+/melibiose symporter-like transporter